MSVKKPIKAFTYQSCFVLFIASLFFFYEYGLSSIFNSLERPIAYDYHLSPTVIGFVSSLYFYANVLFLLPAGALLDRFSPRKIITIAMLICSVGVLIVAMSSGFYFLLIARFMMGIGGGFCFIGTVRVAVNWFEPHHMAKAVGFIVTMGMFGGWAAQAPVEFLIKHFGWRGALCIVALIGFVIMDM